MSKWKNEVHFQEFEYDFDVHGGAVNTDIEISSANNRLPIGAVVLDCVIKVVEAVVGSSSTLGIGNGTSNVGYIPATAEATLALNYLGSAAKNKGTLLWDDTNDNLLPYLVADEAKSKVIARIGTANLTAGKVKVLMAYWNPAS